MVFTGKAVYTRFNEIAEDVSDIVAMVSVVETPFLDMIGDAGYDAENVLHEWLENALNPHVASLTAAVASATGSAAGISVADTRHIKVGHVIQIDNDGKTTHEQWLVVSKAAVSTIYVDRAFGGTSASSSASGDTIRLISTGNIEGEDATEDLSTFRMRLSNTTQILERTISISGSRQNVSNLGGITSEMDTQTIQRLREMTRELEQAAIAGRTAGNTIGSATARRFMAGLQGSITQTRSIGTVTSSMVDDLIQDIWAQGGDADVILAPAALKRRINLFPGSATRQEQADTRFIRQVDEYSGFKGTQRVQMNRYVDTNRLLVGMSSMVRVIPLKARSFQTSDLAKVGDSMRKQIVGEYTEELGTTKSWSAGTNAS